MDSVFRDYWWLIFPIGAFMFGAWDRWLTYRRSRDHLDLIRAYADLGKEPPPELLRGLHDEDMPPGFDPADPRYGGVPSMRWAYRRHYRWGPYWQWRKVCVLAAVAAGFWWASESGEWHAHGALRVVAVILTCVAAANLVFAVLATAARRGR